MLVEIIAGIVASLIGAVMWVCIAFIALGVYATRKGWWG